MLHEHEHSAALNWSDISLSLDIVTELDIIIDFDITTKYATTKPCSRKGYNLKDGSESLSKT